MYKEINAVKIMSDQNLQHLVFIFTEQLLTEKTGHRYLGWDWVHLVRRPLIGLVYQPRMLDDDDDEYGAVGGMRIGRGNRSTRSKPAPVPIFPPQIPHDLTWDRTWAAAMRSRQLTAWAMAWPVITQKSTEMRHFILKHHLQIY
jgi:hypothetical protein